MKASYFLDASAFLGAMKKTRSVLDIAGLSMIEATGEQVVMFAQSFSPDLTGDLRESIKVQGSGIDGRGPFVDVGTTEDYAIYQEFGTEHNPAHPFMRPALAAATHQEIPTARIALAPKKRK